MDLSFGNVMGTHLSNKYGQKLLGSAKKSTTYATGDLTGNKIRDKKNECFAKRAAKNDDANNIIEVDVDVPKKKDTYHQKKDNKLLKELRLVPKKHVYF